jgi:hypothetical protein
LYQVVNCLVWAGLIGGVGYLLGGLVAEIFHGWFKWIWMVASAVLAVLLVRFVGRLLDRSRRNTGAASAWDRTAAVSQPPSSRTAL